MTQDNRSASRSATRSFKHPEPRTEELWTEHGWALTGWQTGGIVAIIGLACVLLGAA